MLSAFWLQYSWFCPTPVVVRGVDYRDWHCSINVIPCPCPCPRERSSVGVIPIVICIQRDIDRVFAWGLFNENDADTNIHYIHECDQRNPLIALYVAGSTFGVQTDTLEGSFIHPCVEHQALVGCMSVARPPSKFDFLSSNARRVRVEPGGELFCIAPIWHVVDAKAYVMAVLNYLMQIAHGPRAV